MYPSNILRRSAWDCFSRALGCGSHSRTRRERGPSCVTQATTTVPQFSRMDWKSVSNVVTSTLCLVPINIASLGMPFLPRERKLNFTSEPLGKCSSKLARCSDGLHARGGLWRAPCRGVSPSFSFTHYTHRTYHALSHMAPATSRGVALALQGAQFSTLSQVAIRTVSADTAQPVSLQLCIHPQRGVCTWSHGLSRMGRSRAMHASACNTASVGAGGGAR